jgi:hypothetical protein
MRSYVVGVLDEFFAGLRSGTAPSRLTVMP